MGLTHKIYTIEPKVSIGEIINISRLINDNAIKKSAPYYCRFKLTDQSRFDEIKKRFPVDTPNKWRAFTIEIPDSRTLSEVIQLQELYERFTLFSHKPYEPQSKYLAYSIDIFKDLNELNLLFYLPQDSNESRLERIKDVMGALAFEEVILMGEEEVNLIFPSLIDLNKPNRRFGTWSYTNEFKVEAGSTFVRLRFDEMFFKRWNTQIYTKAFEINECLAKITNNTDCYKGFIYTCDTKGFLATMNEREYIELTTGISIDLKNYEKFNIHEVLQISSVAKEIEVEIDGISWLSSDSSRQNSTVNIWFNEESYDFEISIYKDEPDEVISNIEEIIGHKLVFKEWS